VAEFFAWLFDPANSVRVGAWGLILGILGTILTVVGFALTGWQLWRTANATRAAAIAVANIKSRVAAYDAIFEISRATSAMKEIERHLKVHNWPEAVDSYTEFRHALVRLIELPSQITDDFRESLKNIHAIASAFSDRLELSISKGKMPGDVSRSISENRRYVEILARISILLEGAS